MAWNFCGGCRRAFESWIHCQGFRCNDCGSRRVPTVLEVFGIDSEENPKLREQKQPSGVYYGERRAKPEKIRDRVDGKTKSAYYVIQRQMPLANTRIKMNTFSLSLFSSLSSLYHKRRGAGSTG